jgi:hypothetical protein
MPKWTSNHSIADRVTNLSGVASANRLNGDIYLVDKGFDFPINLFERCVALNDGALGGNFRLLATPSRAVARACGIWH